MMSRRKLIWIAAAFAAFLFCVALAVRVSQKTAASSSAANGQSAAFTQKDRDPEFWNPILGNRTRPDDLTAFSYAHLRFCVDNFDGVPARTAEVLSNHDIDATLDSMGEIGKTIKAGIMSTDLIESFLACDDLGLIVDDGGHTALMYYTALSYMQDTDDPLLQEYVDLIGDENNPLGVFYSSKVEDMLDGAQVLIDRTAVRDEAYGDETYVKKGDTAVIVFDSFASDMEGWRDYFAGKGERPSAVDVIAEGDYKGMRDTVAIVSEGLARAKEDPEVKNVILDISNNGGGSLDVLEYIASVVCGREYHQWLNTLTGQWEKEHFDVDRNLDGAFDEKDDLVDYSDLHIAVLTSCSSFSCSNLLPSVLADAGVMVMGERSGGGSCAVQKCVFADGVGWQMSTWRGKLINDTGHEIDDGVPVDLLERTGSKKTESGLPDYIGFYDIDLLSEVMNEYYGEESLAEAA